MSSCIIAMDCSSRARPAAMGKSAKISPLIYARLRLFLCIAWSIKRVFFFQAEDGRRDGHVTGVQTCALPISRVRAEVRAKDGEPVEITEHFKPGIEEIAAVLPPAWAKRLLAWGERTGRMGKTYFSMHLRSTTVLGLLHLRLVAGLQSWRPNTYRFAEEQAEIDRWLEQIRTAGRTNVDLAREIAECARLIKGYGDTYKRGLVNYRRITAEVIEPALARRMTPRAAADAVASARVAALADPEGDALSKTLAAIAAASPALRHAAE